MKHYYLVKIGNFNVLNSVMKKELLMGLFFGVVVSFWWKKTQECLQVSVFQSKNLLIFIIIFQTESLGLTNIKKSPLSFFCLFVGQLV